MNAIPGITFEKARNPNDVMFVLILSSMARKLSHFWKKLEQLTMMMTLKKHGLQLLQEKKSGNACISG